MNDNIQYHCIIVGGGLAGSLLFYGLKSTYPKSNILLIEENNKLAGNHTWCFHEGDIKGSHRSWIRDLITKSWDSYEVIFPRYKRTLKSSYHAIQSAKLHDQLFNDYPGSIWLNSKVSSLKKNEVELSSGRIMKALCVVDSRGWKEQQIKPSGFQKFVGLDLKLKNPHHLKGVRLKDVRVKQTDGYRFVYALPWSEDEVLIEDTYYSNENDLNIDLIKKEILNYAQMEGWEVESILRVESGRLPLVSSFENIEEGETVILGARSGQYQPVTGYTFPQTFQRIEELLSLGKFDTDLWKNKLKELHFQDKKNRSFFHFLNKLLFHASSPNKRYLILEHFYTLPTGLIERFYRGKLSTKDKFRIFLGKPPVSILNFFRVMIKGK